MGTTVVDLKAFQKAANQFDRNHSTPQKAKEVLIKIGASIKSDPKKKK